MKKLIFILFLFFSGCSQPIEKHDPIVITPSPDKNAIKINVNEFQKEKIEIQKLMSKKNIQKPKISKPIARKTVISRGQVVGWRTGKASWYGGYFHGRRTASGEIYNKNAMTCAAAPFIPMGSILEVSYNSKTIQVRVTDRGAFYSAKYGYRVLDLSEAAFKSLAPLSTGVITVKYRILR